MDSLCWNDPLIDGNKRCAWIAVRLVFFRNRGLVWTLGDDSAYELVIEASDSHLHVDVLAERLQEGFHPRDQR